MTLVSYKINNITDKMIKRFSSKINKTDNCWIWIASKDSRGYGKFWIKDKYFYAHRFSYQIFKGQIHEDLVLDHLCHNKSCVNPNHLEEVTIGENVLRGNSISGINSRKTHCKNDHEFTLESTYFRLNNGNRMCKICEKVRVKQYYKDIRIKILKPRQEHYKFFNK